MKRQPKSAGTIRPALAFGVACLVLLFAPADARNVERRVFDITVLFVETTQDRLDEAEAALGFSLDPTRGRCFLSSAKQDVLLGAVVGEDRGRVVGKGSIAKIPSNQKIFKAVEQLRLPWSYEARLDPGDPSGKPRLVPSEFVTREVGIELRTVITALEDRTDVVYLWLHVIASRVSGWRNVVPGAKEPVIKTWDLMTAIHAPLGKTIVLVNRPHEPFESSAVFPTGTSEPRTVMLLLIRVAAPTAEAE